MKKSNGSSKQLGSFLSPGIEIQKGWSSERRVVQQAASSSRRSAQFSSGRTMPSKWDDAERWICSPIVGQSNSRASYSQVLRRPKSKSGPILPPSTGYHHSNYSPAAAAAIPLRQGLLVRNLMAGSPFTTGVLAPDALSLHHFDGHLDITASVLNRHSPPTWSEVLCISQDENRDGDGTKNPCLRLDKGTQMSPQDTDTDSDTDEHSSPKPGHSATMKLEVRDVEVDSQATTVFGHSKLESPRGAAQVQASCLDITKIQREEAKIVAWESLQKAKAEAAIRKLEMKLEKKRSSAMGKILNKLRRAQMKAEKMRSLIISQQQQGSKNPRKVFSLIPSRCFVTHSP